MQYFVNGNSRESRKNFQFDVVLSMSFFVNGPFTAPIEVLENTRAVGDPGLFDFRFPAGIAFDNRVQLSGADANLFTANISFTITPADGTTTAHIDLAFTDAPNFEDPQGGPDNISNDYQVNLTVGEVGRNITVRVTDEPEPPREFVLRPVRVTPTSITIDWDEPVNTGPPFSIYQARLFQRSSGTGRFNNIDRSIRTFKYTGLTPNTEYEITVRVATAEGSRTSNLVRVTTPPPLAPAFAADATIPDQIYVVQRLRSPKTLPEATGGNGAITYTLTGPTGETVSEASPGLSFDPATRVLGGKPDSNAITPATTYTYTAMDADDNTGADDTATLEFSITVDADNHPHFTHQQLGMAFLVNEFGRRALPEAVGGNGVLTYQLAGEVRLPPGLTYDGTARPPTISGTPTALFAKDSFTYAVGDADIDESERDIDVQRFNIAVVESFPDFFEAVADQRLSENAPFTLVLPDAGSGTPPRTFTLTGPNGVPVSEAVPGLRFISSDRTISGTPTTPATTTLTYTVTDFNEATDTVTFRVIVAPAVALTDTGNQTYTKDTEIPALTLPAATGGTIPLTYTLTGPNGTDLSELPAGLMWTGTATNPGAITGKPTAITASPVTLTYTATDQSGGTDSDTFTVTVAAAVALADTGDQTYTVGTEIPALTLPEATGGTAPLTYNLTGPNGTDLSELPAGLLWTGDATNPGTITGTPVVVTSPVTLTYTATDQNGGTDSDTFTVTVAAAVALADTGDQTYTMGTEIPALTLPEATGGTGELTYTLTGPDGKAVSQAVPDLTFDGKSRTLSGKLTAAGTTDLTYTATDQNGSTASATFSITVAAAVALNAPNDQTYTMSRPITDLTLPMASGGTGTLTYILQDGTGNDVDAIDNAVPGLAFTATTRVLSGTPTTATTTVLTYTVTGQNGSTAFGYLYHDRGGRSGTDCPGRPVLYDGHHDSRPDPAGGHRRHYSPDLHPAGHHRQ